MRYGFAYPARRSKSSLFRRRVRVYSALLKFPYGCSAKNYARGIAARGRICTNYTFCAACILHLLARQDTDYVGMRIPRASRSRYCGSAEMYEQTDLEMICIDLTCAPHSRTCLPLGILSLRITLAVLFARIISSPGKMPTMSVCA